MVNVNSSQLIQQAVPRVSRANRLFKAGWAWGKDGALLSLPFIAFEAANAERGEKLPAFVSGTLGLATFAVLAPIATAAVGLAVPILPVAVAAFAAGILVAFPNGMLEEGMYRGIRSFTKLNRNVRHLEMGGNYQDSETAERHRFLAIRDMSSAFQSRRQFLGQEAAILHR